MLIPQASKATCDRHETNDSDLSLRPWHPLINSTCPVMRWIPLLLSLFNLINRFLSLLFYSSTKLLLVISLSSPKPYLSLSLWVDLNDRWSTEPRRWRDFSRRESILLEIHSRKDGTKSSISNARYSSSINKCLFVLFSLHRFGFYV